MSNELPASDASPPPLQRRLATILSADVAGYSRMMEQDEEGTVQTLRAHRAVFDSVLAQHHGRVFNTAGDAILAEFPSAVEAVRCATEIQSALQTRNAQLAPERRMHFRMGINLGDVVIQDGDLLGDGVNVASRIQTVADPGGICISGSVYDQIQNKLSLQFRPLGGQSFKNIGQPVRTFTITHGENGALPASGRRRLGASPAAVASGAALVAAIAAGGYWLYTDNEAKRLDRAALTAQLESEKRAASEARRAADEEKRAADAARMARAGADAKKPGTANAPPGNLVAETTRGASREGAQASAPPADSRPSAARTATSTDVTPAGTMGTAKMSTTKAQAGAAASPATPTSSDLAGARANEVQGKFDGKYNGRVCNTPQNSEKRCWLVALVVKNGSADASWSIRTIGKQASLHAAIADDGSIKQTLDGWKISDATPLAGAMTGRIVGDVIDAEGRWSNGAHVQGHWRRAR